MKKPPLQGIRVIEHGQLLAVPYAARMLADLGAEVIKVESAVRLDSHRQTTYPDNDPGERYWDRGGTFYSENRGKLGMTLDLRVAEARDVFRDLVRHSDVVMENFTTRVMANFGLDYDKLTEIKPDIVMLSSTGYGHTGPWANYRAVGPSTEGASGVAVTAGYADTEPIMAEVPYTDYIAAENGVLAVMLALFRRKRSGRGAYIDLSQVESQAALAGELFLDAAANATRLRPNGNRRADMAPHGFFPCAGNDRWLAIAVATDAEWRGLVAAMGAPQWAQDEALATTDGRLRAVDDIESRLGAWTSQQDAYAAMRLLQAQGVPAGVAQDARDLIEDPQLRARGFWQWSDHPEGTGIERKPYPSAPWRFSQSRRGEVRRGSALGEHNAQLCRELLGYSDERVQQLTALGAFGGLPSDFTRPRPITPDDWLKQHRAREFDPDFKQRIAEDRTWPEAQ